MKQVEAGRGTPDLAAALPAPDEKAASVQRMFDAIAPRYDLLNHVLSLNMDRRWRRRAVDRLLAGRAPRGTFLDACAGTLDLSEELARRPGFEGTVVGSDFTYAMLDRGREKAAGRPIAMLGADALRLPFGDGVFDGVTVGFGVRNLASLDDGLRELFRVLRPGGRLVILEFTTPAWQPFRAGYLFYFRRVLPTIGRLVSKHGSAYSYLPASVLAFPEPDALAGRMRQAGFAATRWERATGGIVAIHVGERATAG
jgi:demethylmenaquinone methyltransferase / 2-methoxy-6-polyprenyl-1,4-benzoquinol methylase